VQQVLDAAAGQSRRNVAKEKQLLAFYESRGLVQAEAILKAAELSYKAGEISFAELSQFLTQAIDIRKNYLDVLHQYNQSAINMAYYSMP